MNTYATVHYSPIFPIVAVALPAAVVTALLVLLMHSLITTDFTLIEDDPIKIAAIVRPDTDLSEPSTVKPPEKPIAPVSPPTQQVKLTRFAPQASDLLGQFVTTIPGPDRDIEVGVGGGGIVAYLKPQPIYPSRPLSKGIEGHVDLAFDIAATGSTTNIRVIAAQPLGVFDRAAIKALKKWKYKVPVIDGIAQRQVDMMTRITFELEK